MADGDERRARLRGHQPLKRVEVDVPVVGLRDDLDSGARPLSDLPARYSFAGGLLSRRLAAHTVH